MTALCMAITSTIDRLYEHDTVVGMVCGSPGTSDSDPATGPLAVEVLVDGSGRLGPLSYLVPDQLGHVGPGCGVVVPFGKRNATGVVLGMAADPSKATREVLETTVARSDPGTVAVAELLARLYFGEAPKLWARLSPAGHHTKTALDSGPVVLHDGPAPSPKANTKLTYLLRAPLVDPAELAAAEAARLYGVGGKTSQVLVLCPTKELADRVLGFSVSGAARLDGRPPASGASAWRGFSCGSVHVGVGTRQAALWSGPGLTAVVVVEDSHPGHIEATQPYTNARDVSLLRAREMGLAVSMIGLDASPEALVKGVRVVLVGGTESWPEYSLVVRNKDGGRAALPQAVSLAVAQASKRGVRPVVLTECQQAVHKCSRCHADRSPGHGAEATGPGDGAGACPQCGGTKTYMLGWDPRRIERLFGGRVSARTYSDIATVSDAGLVILFDIDSTLLSARLQPGPALLRLLLSAGGAAGRGGEVLVVTGHPENRLLTALFNEPGQEQDGQGTRAPGIGPGGHKAASRAAWAAAREAGLPPFGHLATIRCGQQRQPRIDGCPGTVYGPRRTGDEWELLVRYSDTDTQAMAAYLTKLRRGGKVRLSLTGILS